MSTAIFVNPLLPTVAIWYSYKASCAKPVKPSFLIFDIRTLWRSVHCPCGILHFYQ